MALPVFSLIVFFIFESCNCARILCISPLPLYSHQSVFQPIWSELSLRKHEVTVITTNPIKNSSLINLHEIDLSFTYKLFFEDHNMLDLVNAQSNVVVLMKHLHTVLHNITVEQFENVDVQELINSDKRFDLLIVEAHVPAWLSFAVKYNCPFIVITSMEPNSIWKKIMGNMHHPIYNQNINLPFYGELNIIQRISAVLFDLVEEFQYFHIYLPSQQRIAEKYLNISSNLLEISYNASLLFANVIPGFNGISTKIPSIIELHGLQIKSPKSLAKDIKKFLDEAKQGLIYFSLGSNLRSSLITDEKIRIFFRVFQQLPYRVLWKFDNHLNDPPDNIKFVKWAPQQDVLRHNNTKLFITQGGIQSIEESIYYKIPILGVPFYGDQFHNVRAVVELGFGSYLDINKFTNETTLKESIVTTINNATYGKNLGDLSELLIERPVKSIERAVWWIEYVIKYRGAKHLKSPIVHVSFYQYYLLDVILFLIVIIAVITYCCVKLFKCWSKMISDKIKFE